MTAASGTSAGQRMGGRSGPAAPTGRSSASGLRTARLRASRRRACSRCVARARLLSSLLAFAGLTPPAASRTPPSLCLPSQTILETYPAYNAKVSTSKASAASTALGPQHLSQAPLPVASSLLPSPAVLGAGTPSPLRPGQAPPVTRLAPVPLGPGAEQDVSVARNGKKRIRPTHVGGNSSAAGLLSAQGSAAGGGAGAGVFGGLAQGGKEPEIIRIDANGNKVPPPPTTQQRQQAQQALAAKSAVPARLQPVVTLSGSTASLTPLNSDAMDVDDDDVVVETAPARLALASRGSAEATWTVDPSADSSAGAGAGASSKRKATDDGGPLAGAPPAGTRIKGKTLGEGLKRASGVERELRPAGAATSAAAGPGGGAVGGGDVLPRLGVKTVLKASSTDDNGEWAEAHNSLTGAPSPSASSPCPRRPELTPCARSPQARPRSSTTRRAKCRGSTTCRPPSSPSSRRPSSRPSQPTTARSASTRRRAAGSCRCSCSTRRPSSSTPTQRAGCRSSPAAAPSTRGVSPRLSPPSPFATRD